MPASLEESILTTVQSEIQGLSLDGIASGNVIVGKVARDHRRDLKDLPGVVIACFSRKRLLPGGTNASNDIEYPILVVTLQKTTQDQLENRDRSLDWHERILTKFHDKRLGAVTGLPTVVDPSFRFEPQGFRNNLDVGVLILRVRHRQTKNP
jgi:hypothetical protein